MRMMGIRLLYITYNENVLDSGILYTQVRRMLELTRQDMNVEKIRLISFISPRLWLKRRNGYQQLKRQLAKNGIDFRFYWMFAAQTWHWYAIPIALLTSLPILLLQVFTSGCEVIHSRGYMAGLLGFLSARSKRIKFVFDPRGEYPEEMAINDVWQVDGMTFRLWKAIERYLIRRSDAITGVTPAFKHRYNECGARKALFVPNRGEVNRFTPFANHDAVKSNPTLMFIGEMDSVWYHPDRIIKNFMLLRAQIPDLKLRIITRADPTAIHRCFGLAGIDRDEYTIESSTPQRIPHKIAGATIGLVLALRNSNNWPVKLNRLIKSDKISLSIQTTGNWPVKYMEYLAAGVPIVVDRLIGSHISDSVRRNRLGITICEDDPTTYVAVADLIEYRSEYSDRCVRYARMKLDLSHTVKQHVRLYRQLIGSEGVR